jgi:hypothetical protein
MPLCRFAAAEDGAVTVDWVVLTAAVVSLVFIAMAGIQGNMSSIGGKVESNLASEVAINTTFN